MPTSSLKRYQARNFTLSLPEDWQDQTVYTLTGPTRDDFTHQITINVDPDVQVDRPRDYADWQIRAVEEELKGCRFHAKKKVTLKNGLSVYLAVFSWCPVEGIRLYREQVYVLYQKTGYILTATFTKKTRKTIGPQIERMIFGFQPVP